MSSPLTFFAVSVLFDLALKSAAIVLFAAVLAASFGRASAAWRHLVWCLSVLSLLLLPLLSLALPSWRVAWLPQWTFRPTSLAATRPTELAPAEPANKVDATAAESPLSAAAEIALPHSELHNPPVGAVETAAPPRSAVPWPTIAWSAGVLLSLVPLAIGLWQLGSLRRRAPIVSDRRWLALLDVLRRQLGIRRHVQLRQGESPLAPLTWGAIRPVLLVPSAAAVWSDERRRLVLLHELAHIRRWDWLSQVAAHIVCAVYWFNPLVWLAVRRMQIERERACDDIVLASGTRPSDYACELLALASGFSDRRVSALAGVPMARRGMLDDRINGILDRRRSRASLTGVVVYIGMALAIGSMAPLAMLRAAGPESAETEAQTETMKPKSDPPAENAANSRPAKRQAEDDGGAEAPLALDNAQAREIWDLSLEEAVQTGLANSKVRRNLGGLLLTAAAPNADQKIAAQEGAKRQGEDSKPPRGAKVRLILARTRDDVALSDFKAGIRNAVSDIERAYWDLYFNYRALNAAQAGRDSALRTWRKVHALFESGAKGGEAEKEAQSREQYFLFRAQAENALTLLNTSEGRLRYLLGLAPTDGRLIRPADDPTAAETRFNLNEVLVEALDRGVELSDQKLDLKKMLTNCIRDLDRNYQVSRTAFNRRVAATKQLEAVQATYALGGASLDMVLDAQRRLADAEIAYYRALADYNVTILQVHFRKGSLLEYNGILVPDDNQDGQPPIDPFRPAD